MFSKEGRGSAGWGPSVQFAEDPLFQCHYQDGFLFGRLVWFGLVKPQSREKYSCIDCELLVPALWRPHTECGASMAGREWVFIRVQSQSSHTLDKSFVELLYS